MENVTNYTNEFDGMKIGMIVRTKLKRMLEKGEVSQEEIEKNVDKAVF